MVIEALGKLGIMDKRGTVFSQDQGIHEETRSAQSGVRGEGGIVLRISLKNQDWIQLNSELELRAAGRSSRRGFICQT